MALNLTIRVLKQWTHNNENFSRNLMMKAEKIPTRGDLSDHIQVEAETQDNDGSVVRGRLTI